MIRVISSTRITKRVIMLRHELVRDEPEDWHYRYFKRNPTPLIQRCSLLAYCVPDKYGHLLTILWSVDTNFVLYERSIWVRANGDEWTTTPLTKLQVGFHGDHALQFRVAICVHMHMLRLLIEVTHAIGGPMYRECLREGLASWKRHF